MDRLEDGYEIFAIKYEGGHAKDHSLNLRQLGKSVLGIERILSAGIYVTGAMEEPKTRGRIPFSIQTRPPEPGSLDLGLLLIISEQVVPFLSARYLESISKFLLDWVKSLYHKKLSEDSPNSEGAYFRLMTEITHRMAELSDRDSLSKEKLETFERMFNRTMDSLDKARTDAITPIGRSCTSMHFLNGADFFEIDTDIAQRIRRKGGASLGPEEMMTLQIVEAARDTNKLRVIVRALQGRKLIAYVDDPEIHYPVEQNRYLQAFVNESNIQVRAHFVIDVSGNIVHVRIRSFI